MNFRSEGKSRWSNISTRRSLLSSKMVVPGSPRHELLKSWKVTLWVLSRMQFLKDWFLLIPCISNTLLNWFRKLYLCYRCVSWREAVPVIWSPVPSVVPGGQEVAGKYIIFIVSHDYLSDHPDRSLARPSFLWRNGERSWGCFEV